MQVEIKDGKKIITHENGHVDEYSIAECKRNRNVMTAQIEQLNMRVIQANLDIAEMQNTSGA